MTYTPYNGKVKLTQPQLRVRREMLLRNCNISYDGTHATCADRFVNVRTFKALLRKDVIRFDRRTEQYVLVEVKPGSAFTNLPSDLKRKALVQRVEALRAELALDDRDFREVLLEIAGQMNAKYLLANDCKQVLSHYGVAA